MNKPSRYKVLLILDSHMADINDPCHVIKSWFNLYKNEVIFKDNHHLHLRYIADHATFIDQVQPK